MDQGCPKLWDPRSLPCNSVALVGLGEVMRFVCAYVKMLVVGLSISVSLLGQQTEPRTPPNGQTAEATAKPALDLTPDANGSLSQAQMQQLFRAVAAKDLENDRRQRNYTYVKREVETKLDSKGNPKSTEVKTYDVLEIYGDQVERLIEKDDKPLPKKDADKEEEKIRKIIEKRKNESAT